jgi:hypothetical protein
MRFFIILIIRVVFPHPGGPIIFSNILKFSSYEIKEMSLGVAGLIDTGVDFPEHPEDGECRPD